MYLVWKCAERAKLSKTQNGFLHFKTWTPLWRVGSVEISLFIDSIVF